MIGQSVTLLTSYPKWEGISWDIDRRLQRCTFKEILQASTSQSFSVMPLERIVIEGPLENGRDFLVLLLTLHPSFTGDVLYICRPDRAFLSAQANGCERVMYTLSRADIDFYVDVNGLRRHGEESSFQLISDSVGGPAQPHAMQVLIVENDLRAVRSMTSVLSGLGCQTLVAESHLDAIQLVGQRRPDVVFLSDSDTGINAAAVARFAKRADVEYRPRTIMVSTGEQKCESGVDGYVTQPIAVDQIGSAIFGTNQGA